MKLLEYKGVNICQEGVDVLSSVDFSLEQGEFVYLCGKVGSGKSSLLKTLYAELPIKEGEARIFDYDLVKLKRKTHLIQRHRLTQHLRRRLCLLLMQTEMVKSTKMMRFIFCVTWCIRINTH